jgi:hypothetical protein
MKIINICILIILLLFLNSIFNLSAHHTPGGGDSINANNTRFIDPFTGKRERPNNYAIISYDQQRGAKDNKNIHTTSVFTEMVLGSGNFALNFSVPYLYYDQKDRKDSSKQSSISQPSDSPHVTKVNINKMRDMIPNNTHKATLPP